MKKIIAYCLFILMLFLSACTDDGQPDKNSEPGDTPISLSGINTRAGTPRNDVYVKAFLTSTSQVYFNETRVNIEDGLSPGDTTDIVFPLAVPYYPLGLTTEIQFFAYSGNAPNNLMNLVAGTGLTNDAILSNYGKRKNEPVVNPAYAPNGTPGSTENPAEILQFRHVMTQLTVNIEVNDAEIPPVDPVPSTVRFTLPGVVANGRYSIYSQESDLATATSGSYTIVKGVNYLIPNGQDLVGVALTSLTIDDYVATGTDLTGFKIQPLGAQQEMLLMPGYAYELTFVVNRLQVESITLQKIDWVTEDATADVDYIPYPLNLNFTNDMTGQVYTNTGDDAINKIVLYTDDKTYVGQTSGGTALEFIQLPASGEVNSVALFTANGLLLSMEIPANAFTSNIGGGTLNLQISEGGMLPVNPVAAYDPDTNPYAITTPLQFMNVSKDLTASYQQMNTIDLRTLNLISNQRIFNGFGDFSGIYNGNGYRIDDIDIEAPGLFASNSGVLRGIRILTGTINGTGQAVTGSICGNNLAGGIIVGCINESHMLTEGTTVIGGICGINYGQIIGCLNTGDILNGTTVGGICGSNQNNATDAIIACVNTGMMNPDAVNLGYIAGLSIDSPNPVVETCFGLVGSAQRTIGGPESAIGAGLAGTANVAALEPSALRNQVDDIPVKTLLQSAMTKAGWGTEYQFSFNPVETSVTWPAPLPN